MKNNGEKRWVHKGEYRALVRKRICYCLTGVFGTLFGLCFYVGINSFMYAPTSPAPTSPVTDNTPFHPGLFEGALIFVGVILALVVLVAELSPFFEFFYHCFKAATEVESVHLITPRNHHLAPPVETLVRPSNLPAPRQQAELLRAAPQASKTPAEELLRADTNSTGN